MASTALHAASASHGATAGGRAAESLLPDRPPPAVIRLGPCVAGARARGGAPARGRAPPAFHACRVAQCARREQALGAVSKPWVGPAARHRLVDQVVEAHVKVGGGDGHDVVCVSSEPAVDVVGYASNDG